MNYRSLIQFIDAKKIFTRNDRVLLAVSGGIDSTVMAHLFHRAKFRFAIAHCNFGLRGNDSEDDAGFVRKLALEFNVPFFSEKFDTASVASQNGISIQMAARDLRYGWFEKIRQECGFDYIATAHHLDDQAETFLINLIRGTGIAGLHGIPVKNGRIVRPMMFAYRKDIEQYALKHKIMFRTDLSNNETKYVRNKLRHDIIPLLLNLNPEFTHGLAESIRRINDFEQIGNRALNDWCRNVLTISSKEKFIEIKHLLEVTPAEPYAWALLAPLGFNETQVSNILSCLEKEHTKIFSSSTHRLIKERERLVIKPIEQEVVDKSFLIGLFASRRKISMPMTLFFKRIREVKNFEIPAARDIASLDFEKLQFPLTIRKWKHGDVFYPLGMKKKKKLSDFFIDQKFSLSEKEQTWLLCSGTSIVWIIGKRIDHRYRVTSATREILGIHARDT